MTTSAPNAGSHHLDMHPSFDHGHCRLDEPEMMMGDGSATPGVRLTPARAVIDETHATIEDARATAIQTREHVRQLRDLIADARRMIEASRETLKRCPTLW